MHSRTRLNGIKQLDDNNADGQNTSWSFQRTHCFLLQSSLRQLSLSHKVHTRTRLPIPEKYKYIFCCCSKAITSMAIFSANKSRTYRSSLDCQQNKGRTWQSHIQAESTDKQKPIAVCVCVHVQPPHTSSAPARCGLPATYSTEGQTCTICFFFLFAHSASRRRG